MTNPRNIASWTAKGSNYPEFVCINGNDTEVEIIVRQHQAGDGAMGQISRATLPREEFMALLEQARNAR